MKKTNTKTVRLRGITRRIYNLIVEGNSLKDIQKILRINSKYLSVILNRLCKYGFIKRIYQGVYQAQNGGDRVSHALDLNDYLRIHNLEICIRLSSDSYRQIKSVVLKNREVYKTRYNNQNKLYYFDFAEVTGIITKNNIYIYYPEGYDITGKNIRSASYNLYNTIKKTLQNWEKNFRVLLFKDGRVNFDIRRMHIALVNNGIAKEYKDHRLSDLVIYDEEDGKARFLIDFSRGYAELEALHKDHAFADADEIKFFLRTLGEGSYRELIEHHRKIKIEHKDYIG